MTETSTRSGAATEKRVKEKQATKPRVQRPDTTAQRGQPIAAWELQTLNEQYPGGYYLSVYDMTAEGANEFNSMNRRQFRNFAFGGRRYNNRTLHEGRVKHRMKTTGNVQPKHQTTQPGILKRVGMAIKRKLGLITLGKNVAASA